MKVEENKKLIERFPFLLPHNIFTDEVNPDYDYSYTELDAMPDGWRKAFGEQMCQDIKDVLVKENWLDEFRIVQIKEKYGALRFYTNYTSDAIYKIIDHYERLSEKICLICGKTATKMSLGWISPFCDECAESLSDHIKFEDIEND